MMSDHKFDQTPSITSTLRQRLPMAPSTCSRSETPLSSSSSGASSASVGLSNLSYVAKDWKKTWAGRVTILFLQIVALSKNLYLESKWIWKKTSTTYKPSKSWGVGMYEEYIIYLLYRNQFLHIFTIYHGPSWTQFVPTFRPWNFKGTRSLCSSDWSTSVETEISGRDSVGSPVGFSWRKSMVLFPSHLKKQ